MLKNVFGRRIDLIYNTKGEAVSPHMISINMWGTQNIKQFKFTQLSGNKYKILLNTTYEFNKEMQENELKEKFTNLLGKDAIIIVEYTDEIPVLSSGKRKYIENLCKEKK